RRRSAPLRRIRAPRCSRRCSLRDDDAAPMPQRGAPVSVPRRPHVLLGVLVLVGSLASSTAGATSSSSNAVLVKAACSLTNQELIRIKRGVMPGRSGQILIVAREPHFVGASYPHSGPWDYLQRIPMLWYGPGYIP